MKHLLTIAGSDCSGGAGIQADLKTFSAWGAYGMSAISAITAQNTQGVRAVHLVPPEMLAAQIDAVFEDIRVDAVKIGMLGTAAHISEVAACLRRHQPAIVVLDPVMVSKSGHHLLERAAVSALIDQLFPLASLLTPNIPEAELLTGSSIADLDDMVRAGQLLCQRGALAVLVKGGHRTDSATDVLVWSGGIQYFDGPLLAARHTHGTGCSLSSALATGLAQGLELTQAVAAAKSWVAAGIADGLALGKGIGPINHFHALWRELAV